MDVSHSPGADHRTTISVNGRTYRWPARPTVVICFDGCDPEYLDAASGAGVTPSIDAMRQNGFATTALAAIPTFTNPNNISIVCGVPPAVHGVSGNYYIDPQSGAEVMMLDAAPMRAPTILASFADKGAQVIAITAKDKLRKALANNLRGVAFSAEAAESCTYAEHGISDVTKMVGRAAPSQYSADLSLFVLDAGVQLLKASHPDVMYLSLSDYVQHKHTPDSAEALAFMADVDARVGQLLAGGAVVGIVADHGMSDMANNAGTPNVLYVGEILDEAFGAESTRVICPITDPFVRHHGALGGFVRVYVGRPGPSPEDVAALLRTLPGVELAILREEACRAFDLPADREGDVAVFARKGVALGARARDHDLTQLAGERLRSHGGLAERNIPFILSHPLTPDQRMQDAVLHNYDIFDFALNRVEV
jgi:phosphonoacetate hydrolase